MSFFMHILHPLGNLLGIKCTGCGHETKYHHAANYGSWICDICGGRCTSVTKTASMHALHQPVNAFGGVPCTCCSHSSKEHFDIGWGKWKCRRCGSICVA